MNIHAAQSVQKRRDLTVTEKCVAQVMAVHANYAHAECNMSMTLLAAEAGLKKRETASRIVKRLEVLGVIVPADGSHSKGGRSKTTTYVFPGCANCDFPVTDKPKPEPETVTEPPVNCDSPVTVSELTVTENAETVTPQSHEGFKVLSLPFGESLDAGAPTQEVATDGKDEPNNHVVVGGEPPLPADAGLSAVVPPPPSSSNSLNPLPLRESVSSVGRVSSAFNINIKDKVKVNSKVNSTGKENLGQENHEDCADAIIADLERRRVERATPDNVICREFKDVFDRLSAQFNARDKYLGESFVGEVGHRKPNPAFSDAVLDAMPTGIELTWKPPLPKHKKVAAALYRKIGREQVLADWETFLLTADHYVPQRVWDNANEKVIGAETVQRDWLLLHFVKEHPATQ